MTSLPSNPTPNDLLYSYNEGLPGWLWDDEIADEWEEVKGEQPTDALDGIRGASDNVERALLWRSRELFDPGAFGKESQEGPDCTSHGSRSARDITRCVEIHIAGEPEAYVHRGATEITYGARGHGGAGMNPARASRFERDYGFLVRRDYPNLDLDLTTYNYQIGARLGRGGVPEKVKTECKLHNVGTIHSPSAVDEVMDLMASGHGGHSGQQWGTGKSTGSDGLNVSNGSGWNHDMASAGYDKSRDVWKETVFFVVNSWGNWNQRNPLWDESYLGPWIPGMMVVPIDEYDRYFVRKGSIDFYSSIKGFELSHLPDYGFGGV